MIASYLEHGLSMIAVERRGKKPIGSWLHAQTERAGAADVHGWLDEGLNLGVVTGKLSGVVVVDCDSDEGVHDAGRRGIPITPTSTTGRGRHYWFAAPADPVRNAVAIGGSDIDLRGEGGFVIAPPSTHPSGREYRWVTGLSLVDVPLAPCPAWVLEAGRDVSGDGPRFDDDGWAARFVERVPNGQRNHRCAELAGYLLRKWVSPGVVDALLQEWNVKRCVPAMSSGEVSRTVASIAAREGRRRG